MRIRPVAIPLVAVALLAFASDSRAVRLDGNPAMIPVATHASGTAGTQWRTDLWVSNPGPNSFQVVLTFRPTDGPSVSKGSNIGPGSTLEFNDVVLSLFGVASGTGTIMVQAPLGENIEARARIYNAGNPAGEFGQWFPAFASVRSLYKRAFLAGLSGINGNRLNVGVANPNDTAVDVSVHLSDGNNAPLGGQLVHVEPFMVVQVNDIFAKWGIAPAGNVQIDMTTPDLPIYGYASVVRNDSGDAHFVFGSSPGVAAQ